MKKRLLLPILILLTFIVLPLSAQAQEYPESVNEILEQSPVEVTADSSGMMSGLWKTVKTSLSRSVGEPLRLLPKLAAYLMMACLVELLAPAHYKSLLGSLICVGFAGLCIRPVAQAVCEACESAVEWHAYLMSFVPVFAGVMTAGGQGGQAALYSGTFLAASAALSELMHTVVLPFVRMYLSLSAAICFWNDPGINQLHHLMYKFICLCLKGAAGVFSFVLGLQTLLAKSGDRLVGGAGLTLLAGALPVVGGVARQAVEGVAAGLALLKTMLGVCAVLTVTSMVLPVLIPVILYCIALLVISAIAKSVDLSACSRLAEQFSGGLRLCISCLVLYYFLILLTTLLMMLSINGG